MGTVTTEEPPPPEPSSRRTPDLRWLLRLILVVIAAGFAPFERIEPARAVG